MHIMYKKNQITEYDASTYVKLFGNSAYKVCLMISYIVVISKLSSLHERDAIRSEIRLRIDFIRITEHKICGANSINNIKRWIIFRIYHCTRYAILWQRLRILDTRFDNFAWVERTERHNSGFKFMLSQYDALC